MSGETKVGNLLKTQYLWKLLDEQIESGLSGNNRQKFNISDNEIIIEMRRAAESGEHGFKTQLGKTTFRQARDAYFSDLSPYDNTYVIKTGSAGYGRTLDQVRRDSTPEMLSKFDAGEIDENYLRKTSSNRVKKQARAAAEKASQTVDEAAISSTLKGQEAKISQSLESFAEGRAKAHQERFYDSPDSSVRWQAATKWWNKLPEVEKELWRNLVAPIKLYNDNLYRKAVLSGVPAHLDDLIQLHHILPREFQGSNDPRQMIGAIGRSLPQLGTEHATQHYHPSARKFYNFIQSSGGTQAYYPPVSIPMKLNLESGSPVPGASKFESLLPAELNPGSNIYAGLSDAPDHTPSIMNLRDVKTSKIPGRLGAAAALLTIPSLVKADNWGDVGGILGELVLGADPRDFVVIPEGAPEKARKERQQAMEFFKNSLGLLFRSTPVSGWGRTP